jgi:hypothetical protein
MASTIGIKLANGEFYPILEENSNVKRRLILTTVHDTQQSMQIDLYKSFTRSMADAVYIGSIVVENIKEKPKGEPSIEMIITSNAEGEITADAVDLDSSSRAEHLHLSVSLKSINEDNRELELPDFELDSHEPPPQGLYEKVVSTHENQGRHTFPWVVLIIIGVLIILLGLGLWFFVFRGQGGQTAKEQSSSERSSTEPVTAAPAITETAPPDRPPAEPSGNEVSRNEVPKNEVSRNEVSRNEVSRNEVPRNEVSRIEVPVIEAPAAPPPEDTPPESREPVPRRSGRNPPVASYNVPTTISREGHPYRIRWGDTLWDISEAFYRNPWLYPRIARFNNIRNPDFIISGRTIRIPPQN